MNIKISRQQVGTIIGMTGKVVVCALSCIAMIAPHVKDCVEAGKQLTAKADYSGAIKAIMNSDMLSSYKKDAISIIQKDKDASYYKSIIEVVNSDMLGSYILDTIKLINK